MEGSIGFEGFRGFRGNGRWWYRIEGEFKKVLDSNNLVPGDKVYFKNKQSYTTEQLENYLKSIGCERAKSSKNATKIVFKQNGYYFDSLSATLQKEDLEKYVKLSKVEPGLRKILGLEYFEFTEERVLSIYNFLTSRDLSNVKIGAMATINCDWSENEVILKLIIAKLDGRLMGKDLPDIPGWSDFMRFHNINWTRSPKSRDVIAIFQNYELTPEQAKLIYKLLNIQ